MMAEEESFKVQHFYDLTEKRNEARQFTLENDQRLDDLGYDRYKKDMSEIEEHVDKEKYKVLQRARDSFIKLRKSIELTEKKELAWNENFNTQASEAKIQVKSIESDFLNRGDRQ